MKVYIWEKEEGMMIKRQWMKEEKAEVSARKIIRIEEERVRQEIQQIHRRLRK